jgi:transposase
VFWERTSVGLEVHARSIVAGVIDGETGEVRSLRLAPTVDSVVAWVGSLPAPVAVAYEAGPTGFGLARALEAAGVRCVVVAPSKVERPAGDRVKTDRRDAERLARLLRIGELPAVRVPSEAEETARDLVKAQEDARGDLMRARHQLSKLLLRQSWSSTDRPGPGRMRCGCGRCGSTKLGGGPPRRTRHRRTPARLRQLHRRPHRHQQPPH